MEEKVSMVLVSGWHGVTSREQRKGKGGLGRQGTRRSGEDFLWEQGPGSSC